MNNFGKFTVVLVGVAYFGSTFQIFSSSKETPIEAAVPAFANMALTASGGTVLMQVPPGQVFSEKVPFAYDFGQIAQITYVVR